MKQTDQTEIYFLDLDYACTLGEYECKLLEFEKQLYPIDCTTLDQEGDTLCLAFKCQNVNLIEVEPFNFVSIKFKGSITPLSALKIHIFFLLNDLWGHVIEGTYKAL